MEAPTGFEPMIGQLQCLALPAWLKGHNHARKIITKDFVFVNNFFLEEWYKLKYNN